MTIADFLRQATHTLETAEIATARLDTLVFLERTLKQNKAWLLAHGNEIIAANALAALQNYIERRAKREPLAYITGRQEFYGRQFAVTADVLIPRPESEQLIELLKTLPLPDDARMLDIGTGSGALAVTAALELPHLRVEACDISPTALAVAQQNAERLQATIHLFASDLLTRAEHPYDVIIANLPYVSPLWERSPETNFEPPIALFAGTDGLGLIKKLLASAPAYLNQGGFLLLEADPRQFANITNTAEQDFIPVRREGFALVFKKR